MNNIPPQNVVVQKPGALTSFDDFISLRNRLGFQLLQPKETLDAIQSRLGHVDSLRYDEFITFFCDLFKGRYENYYEFVESLGKIFQFIDVDGMKESSFLITRQRYARRRRILASYSPSFRWN